MAAPVEEVSYMLMVQDVERATRFWRDAFGAAIRDPNPHFTQLTLAGAAINLHPGGDGARTASGLSVQVSDIEAAAQAVRESGGQLEAPPEARPGEPIMLGRCLDSEGNAFTIVQYVR